MDPAVVSCDIPPMKAPEKELRFTRARQAVVFWVGGVVLSLVAAGLGILTWWQLKNPPAWWIGLIPLVLAAGSFVMAWRLTRHAYVLLSPVGVELFPFWKPVDHFQLLPWGTIQEADFSEDGRWLTLTLAGYEDAKVILTLDPIPLKAKPLLVRAIRGVMEKRLESASAAVVSSEIPDPTAIVAAAAQNPDGPGALIQSVRPIQSIPPARPRPVPEGPFVTDPDP
ncbi:MAG: hypothetical protein JWQ03_3255 [Variovorax sp.]|nr:hypothetical protein [Variovorax sp.]